MRILVFEWLTGGGLWIDRALPDPASPIQAQGKSMLTAVVEDFLAGGVDVVTTIDSRLEPLPVHSGLQCAPVRASDELKNLIGSISNEVDFVMMIAPETDWCLLNSLTWLGPCQKKLISPDSEFVRVTSCKQSTFEYLKSRNLEAIPRGEIVALGQQSQLDDFPLPVVLKPSVGAGSEAVQLIDDWATWLSSHETPSSLDGYRVEEFVTGTPVSVSVICQTSTYRLLSPTIQRFDREPFGHYLGAQYPVAAEISERATRLAMQVMKLLPPTQGYIGIDMVISDRSEDFDRLIEINPRLTMSYLCLREVHSKNLALSMLPV